MKSTELIQPLAMPAPLAYEGEKNNIPNIGTEGSNAASVKEGFPAITSLPKKEGGLPPARKDFNGMFYLSTDQRTYLQNGGIITFSEEVSDAIGGYPKNAVLDYIDSSDTYHKVQSLIDDNTYNFVTNPSYIDGEHWKEINFGGGSGNMVPYSYGMYMYLDYEMENVCWLQSAGQYNSGTVYSGLYQWLQAERAKGWKQMYGWVHSGGGPVWTLSATPVVGDAVYGWTPRKLNGYVTAVDGNSMAYHTFTETTDQNVTRDTTKDTSGYISVFSDVPVFTPSEITSTNWGYDFDYAWVINTANQTFRVPLKTKTAPLGATAPVVGDGTKPTFKNLKTGSISPLEIYNGSGHPYQQVHCDSTSQAAGYQGNLIFSQTGLETDLSNADSPEGVYLYFYAGNVEENADLINMGEITNALANKVDVSMQNLTAQGKAAVCALAMPDYVNAVWKSKNVGYQAEENAYIYMISNTSGGHNCSLIMSPTVKGLTQYEDILTFESTNWVSSSSGGGWGAFIIPKGWYYKGVSDDSTMFRMKYCPLKGAQ